DRGADPGRHSRPHPVPGARVRLGAAAEAGLPTRCRRRPRLRLTVRIGIGRFTQESNTFSPAMTGLDAFQRQGLAYGDDFDVREHLVRGAIWTFAEIADARGDELVPLVKAWAGPSGPVTR